jgi:hypothetical protein
MSSYVHRTLSYLGWGEVFNLRIYRLSSLRMLKPLSGIRGRHVRQFCQVATLRKHNLSCGQFVLKCELRPAKLQHGVALSLLGGTLFL